MRVRCAIIRRLIRRPEFSRLVAPPVEQSLPSRMSRRSSSRGFVSTSKWRRTGNSSRISSTANAASAIRYSTFNSASGPAANFNVVRGAVQVGENVNFSVSHLYSSAAGSVTGITFFIFQMPSRTALSGTWDEIIDSSVPSSALPLAGHFSIPSSKNTSNAG